MILLSKLHVSIMLHIKHALFGMVLWNALISYVERMVTR